MKQNLQKYLKALIIILVALIAVIGFIYIWTNKMTLIVNGYDYTAGDIVLAKKGRPALGDTIIYDPYMNKSMCMGMGPRTSLGKIVGMPGETFLFQRDSIKIRRVTVTLDRDYSQRRAVFGAHKYQNLAGQNITLQTGEYLIDKWVGLECFDGELDSTGSSIPYERFTINEESIKGIIVRKIGHDKRVKEKSGRIVY